jgi:hypothetical protein
MRVVDSLRAIGSAGDRSIGRSPATLARNTFTHGRVSRCLYLALPAVDVAEYIGDVTRLF